MSAPSGFIQGGNAPSSFHQMKLNGTGALSGNGGPPPNMTVGMNGNISTNPGGAVGPNTAAMNAAAASGATHLQHVQVGAAASGNHARSISDSSCFGLFIMICEKCNF